MAIDAGNGADDVRVGPVRLVAAGLAAPASVRLSRRVVRLSSLVRTCASRDWTSFVTVDFVSEVVAVTLVGFLVTRLAVELLARAHYLSPVRRTFPLVGTMSPNQLTGDWIVSAGIYSAQGARLSGGTFGSFSQTVCPPSPATAPPTAAAPGPGSAAWSRHCAANYNRMPN